MISKQNISIILLALFLIILVPGVVHAAGSITLDGSFEDWTDKPSLTVPQGNEEPAKDIVALKWYPDLESENLFLYAERLNGDDMDNNKKFEDWDFTVDFSSGSGQRTAKVSYHPPSQFVDVELFDENNHFLWSEKGKWGDDKDIGKRVELEIPFSFLTGSLASGYQVDLHFQSGSERAPTGGEITVSTISTFPLETIFGAVLVCMLLFVFGLKIKKASRAKRQESIQ